jgi:hypothetical protein
VTVKTGLFGTKESFYYGISGQGSYDGTAIAGTSRRQ